MGADAVLVRGGVSKPDDGSEGSDMLLGCRTDGDADVGWDLRAIHGIAEDGLIIVPTREGTGDMVVTYSGRTPPQPPAVVLLWSPSILVAVPSQYNGSAAAFGEDMVVNLSKYCRLSRPIEDSDDCEAAM